MTGGHLNFMMTDILWYLLTPNLEQLVLVTFLVRSLQLSLSRIDQSLCDYWSGSRQSLVYMKDRDMRRILCTSMFLTYGFSLLSATIMFLDSSVSRLFLGASLFMALLDTDVFLVFAHWILTFDGNGSIPSRRLVAVLRSPYFREKMTDLCLKILILGIGATSGYEQLESICYIALTSQLTFTLVLCSGFVLYGCLCRPFGRAVKSPSVGKMKNLGSSSNRFRSHSCSLIHRTYPERTPVTVSSVLRSTEKPASQSPFPIWHVLIFCLGVLVFHSRSLGFGEYMNRLLSDNDTASSLQHPAPCFSPYALLNIGLLILCAVVCCYRAKYFGWRRGILRNLNLALEETNNIIGSTEWSSVGISSYCKSNYYEHNCTATPSKVKEPIHNLFESTTRSRHGSGLTPTDQVLLDRLAAGKLKTRELEGLVEHPVKAVELRRMDLSRLVSNPHAIERLPFRDYDYRFAHGQCCEEIIGYIPIPVGKVGPLLLDGRSHYVPLATTEGCLVASTNRGCRALFLSGGVKSVVYRDQMTRAPVVWFPSVLQIVQCIAWIESDEGFQQLKSAFDRTSAHIELLSVFPNPSGHYLHIRFAARTGDAMGMNMVSKATNSALHKLCLHFPDMRVISLSGNMCTDKKPAMINSILGRGKSVIAEACLPATVVAQVLHTTPARLARLAVAKNWTGSAMAGCPGMSGSNAHAANVVAGIFAATGQDLAQVVDASACLTQFTPSDDGQYLIASVTMPCVEVGTVGGGTRLPAQRACLDLLDLCVDRPTEHLARLIAGTVLAGELSLMAALDTDDLVSSHMRLNRATSAVPVTATSQTGMLTKTDASGRTNPPHPTM